jgi:MFS transporter, PAT family, beta-lactamase induction signal transducer AmpG
MRTRAPLWLMGLTYSSFGMYGGLVAVSVPQLMAARHVPESTIAAITAVILSPGFWAFLFSPILDVRFTRRWYSVSTAVAASVLLVLALFSLNHLLLFESLLTAGFFCACMYQSALGGWLASIIRTEDENRLSIWVNIGNICAGGAMAVVASELVRIVSLTTAALILGVVISAPTLVFAWMPVPAADISGARGSLAQFLRDLAILLRRRDVLLALLLFVAPAATFSLTNFLSGVGHDFQASPRFVGLVGGGGVLFGGVCGCLAFPLIDRLMPLRLLYLSTGIAGSLFTLGLILVPHTALAFAIALIGQNVFQSLAFTVSTAISFDAIGRHNPLSATAWCLLVSAYNIPISYMLLVDGWGYNWRGITGSYVADGAVSLLACLVLAAYLFLKRRTSESSALLRTSRSRSPFQS